MAAPIKTQRKHMASDIKTPCSWLELKNGPILRESIELRIDEWLPKLFGYHMLKLGGLSCEINTKQSAISHQVHLDVEHPLHTVIADPYELPFIEKSFDLTLLIHQFDYSDEPHRLLREVDRVMMDDGYLIITGFNPFSMLGLASLIPWRKNLLPWSGRMYSVPRMLDWLQLLNYQVIECEIYSFFPMKRNAHFWAWFDGTFSNLTQVFGSTYFIVARKRTTPLKPIHTSWSLKPLFRPCGTTN